MTAPLIHETMMDQWISLPCWGDCFCATGRLEGDLGLGLDLVIVTPFVVLEFGELSLSDVDCFITGGGRLSRARKRHGFRVALRPGEVTQPARCMLYKQEDQSLIA